MRREKLSYIIESVEVSADSTGNSKAWIILWSYYKLNLDDWTFLLPLE